MAAACSRAARFPSAWCPSWGRASSSSAWRRRWRRPRSGPPRSCWASAVSTSCSARSSRGGMVAEPAARRRRTERPAPAAPALSGVKGEPGPDVARGLDALLHHRLRLGMVSALAAVESLAFNDLKRLLQTSDGNLSVHARKLEDAGYVTYTKRSEEHTSELQSLAYLVCRLLLEKKKNDTSARHLPQAAQDASRHGRDPAAFSRAEDTTRSSLEDEHEVTTPHLARE